MNVADPKAVKFIGECKHPSPLIAARFDPSGRYLFTTAQDNSIQRYTLEWGKPTAFLGHQSWVRAIGFAGSMMVTGDYHGRLLFWSVDAPKPARSVDAAHIGWIRALSISPDGKTVATCGNDLAVRLWSIAEGKLIRELIGHESHVYHVAFHPDGKRLASADLHGNIIEWELATGTKQRTMEAKAVLHKYDPSFRADIGGVRSMAFNGDGSLLACAGITNVSNAFAGVGNPVVVLFDWATAKVKQTLKPKEAFQGTAWGVAFHREGFIIGVGGGDGGAIWYWKPEEATSFHTHKNPIPARDLAMHPDGVRFAIAGSDGAGRVYTLAKA